MSYYPVGSPEFVKEMERQAWDIRKRRSEVMEKICKKQQELEMISIRMGCGTELNPKAEVEALRKFRELLFEADVATSLLLHVTEEYTTRGNRSQANGGQAVQQVLPSGPVQAERAEERESAESVEDEGGQEGQEQQALDDSAESDDDDDLFPGVASFEACIPEATGKMDRHDRVLPLEVSSNMTPAEKKETIGIICMPEDRKRRPGRWFRPCGRLHYLKLFFEKKLESEGLAWINTTANPHQNVKCAFCNAIGKHFSQYCCSLLTLQERTEVISAIGYVTSGPCFYCKHGGEIQFHPATLCPKVVDATRIRHIIRFLSD